MGESKRFHAHIVGDSEERTSSAIALPLYPTGVDRTAICNHEAMANGSCMLFVPVIRPLFFNAIILYEPISLFIASY